MDPELVAKSWDSDLGKSLFTEERKKLLPAVLSRLGITTTDDTTLESLQNNPAVIRKVWAKEQKVIYERILGAKGSKLIERAKRMHVYELIANPDTKEYGVKVSTKLLGKLRTCAKDERHRMIAYTISGFAGAVFTILAYAASPAHAFVWSMGILISYGVIAYADFLGLKKAWASEGPIGNSKHYIILHLLVGIAIAATIAATGITGGIFPVAVVALIGLVWLFMDIYALYKAYEKEKAYNAEHPTLEMFLERIKKDGSLNTALDELDKDHTLKMFHKLPKVQREAILRDLQEMMESVDPEFIPGLHTLKLSEDMSEVETGKCLYKELSAQNKALAKRALKQANKVLLSGSEKLKKSNLETHENSDLFYKAFYEEFVKREQRNLLRRAGSTRLRHSVEKVSRDRIEALAHFQKNLSS